MVLMVQVVGKTKKENKV